MTDKNQGKAPPASIEATVPEIVDTLGERSDSDLAGLLVREMLGDERVTLIDAICEEQKRRADAALLNGVKAIIGEMPLDELVGKAVEKHFDEAKVTVTPDAVEGGVKAYLDEHLEERVKAAMPETPEQRTARERASFEETVEKGRKATARKAKREAKKAEKAAQEAAEAQAKRDAAAEKAFEDATPFAGDVADITAKIVRGIAVDNGRAYSADHRIEVRHSELEPIAGNALLLNKAIELPARGREFAVKGISLLTDAGVLRTELNGLRKCGGGNAVHFPSGSLVFRPAPPPKPEAEAETAE